MLKVLLGAFKFFLKGRFLEDHARCCNLLIGFLG